MQIRAEITITRVRKRLETHARQIKRCKEFSCSNIKRLMHHSIWVYHYMMTGTNRKFCTIEFYASPQRWSDIPTHSVCKWNKDDLRTIFRRFPGEQNRLRTWISVFSCSQTFRPSNGVSAASTMGGVRLSSGPAPCAANIYKRHGSNQAAQKTLSA